MANTDFFRVRIGDNGDDNGYVELATADAGNEPIYIRQYLVNGTKNFGTITHEACLLDANGNTTFPGGVTAKSIDAQLKPIVTNDITSLNSIVGTRAIIGGCSTENTDFLKQLPSEFNGADFNGIQIGDNNQRIQLVSGGNSLYFRSNDDTLSNTTINNWGGWSQFAFMKDVTAANTGGIVAQSLGANGYVKFANGLILQWGIIPLINISFESIYSNGAYTARIEKVISTSLFFYGNINIHANGFDYTGNIGNNTNDSFYMTINSNLSGQAFNAYWFIIGQ